MRRATVTTYYHATRETLTLRAGALCVTRNRDAAEEYLDGQSGHVYVVSLRPGLHLADASDVRSIARRLVPQSPYTRAYELIEEHRVVRQALIDAGYDGVEYDDETPNNATAHDCTLVFDAIAAVASVEEV